MRTLALLLALTAAAPQDDRVPALVRQLEDDSAEVRETATKGLAALGEAVRGRIESALRETSNAEVQARLRDVLRRLDAEKVRKSFVGGKVVDHLGARLTAAFDQKTRLLSVTLEITNLGAAEKPLVEITGWNVALPRFTDRTSSAEGEVRVKQLTGGKPSGFFRSRTGCGPEPVRKSVVLKPGASRTFQHTVDVSELAAGEHEVEAVALKRLLGTSEDLVSNAVRFRVED